MREKASPGFIESVARSFDVIRAFGSEGRPLSLSEVAARAGLARPTAHRFLTTLMDLDYVRNDPLGFSLTPRVLDLGLAYISATGLWDSTRYHLQDLVEQVHESCSVAQLSGSDIVYVARVAVPKLVALRVDVGTRFPAAVTSLGKVLLAELSPAELRHTLNIPSASEVITADIDPDALLAELAQVRERGWAATDQQLAPAVRSVAVPLRSVGGRVVASVNVNAHAMETSMDELLGHHLPLLQKTAARISEDLLRFDQRPTETRRP